MTGGYSRAALAVVDMQEDFCEPYGALAIKGARQLAPIINGLLSMPGFVLKFATQDSHPPNHISFASQHSGATGTETSRTIRNPENEDETQEIILWPDHCIQGTSGAELIPEIDHSQLGQIVQKGWDARLESLSGFGPAFRNPPVAMTKLNDMLKGESITHVFVVGVAFDGCVKHTALDAANFGYETFVIEDGVNAAARHGKVRSNTFRELQEQGVRVIGLHSEELYAVRTGNHRERNGGPA